MNGQLLARSPSAETMASSLLAMNVSAIQAMPNRAIIATIPERKIDMPRDVGRACTLRVGAISAAAVSITIWMIGVTDSGSVPPSSLATVGRMLVEEAEDADDETAPRKIATLRLA